MKRFVLLILFVLFLNGCTVEQKTENNIIMDSTDLPAPLDMDQSVYFSMASLEGTSAMSISRIMYEQPEISKNVEFEYLVYMDEFIFDDALSNEAFDFLCVPFEKGVDILLHTKGYVLYAIMENQSEDQPPIALALLVKQATLNIYPEVVATFFSTYYKSSVWANDHLDRLTFYLEQLEIESEIVALTYKRAWVSEAIIISALELSGKTEEEINNVVKSIFKP